MPSSLCWRRNSSGRDGGPPVGLGERPSRFASPTTVGAGPGNAMPNTTGLRASKVKADRPNIVNSLLNRVVREDVREFAECV
jgi:hypothetical protein